MTPSEKNSSIRYYVIISAFSNYLGQIVIMAIGFVLTPFILRQLGETHNSLWILAGSVVAYGNLLDLGIMSAATKYVAEYRARGEYLQAQRLVATTLWLYTALGLIAIVLSALIAPFFPMLFNIPEDERQTTIYLVFLMGLSLGVSLPTLTAVAVLRGLKRFDLANSITIIGTLLNTIATVAVLLAGGGLLGMIAINIPLAFFTQVWAVWLIRRIAPELHFGWRGASRQLMRTVFTFSSSIFLGQIAGQLQNKTDELVIGARLPLTAVTPYNFARRLSELAQVFTRQSLKALLPLASQLHAENDQARLRALYLTSSRLAIASFAPIGGSIVILARPFLTLWVGAPYADAAPLVFILALSSLIDTSQWPAASILQGMARHQVLAIMSITSGVVNLVLSLILVKPFGVTGVALGTLIPTTIICLFFIMPYAIHAINIKIGTMIREVFWPALAPAVPMLLTLYLLREWWAPASWFALGCIAAAGALVYGIVYLSFSVNVVERQTCRQVAYKVVTLAQTYWKNHKFAIRH